MRITLTVTDGPHTGQSFSFSGHDTFLVGRSRRSHFRLPEKDKYFSRVHFLIEVNPPRCRIMDMGSRNGTYVNGTKVDMNDLSDGDQIRAGHTMLRVSFEHEGAEMVSTAPEEDVLEVIPEVVETPPPPLPPTPPPPPPPPLPQAKPRSSPQVVVPPVPVAPLPLCHACEAPLVRPTDPLCTECQALITTQPQPVDGYHLIRVLGKGSMGVVYLALRRADQSVVALKSIVPAVAGTRAQVERFLREAEILRQLNHPNIVTFRDMGESSGRIYFAMDFVRGTDAARLLDFEGPFSIQRAVNVVCQLLRALEFAHERGFVHRDIKPANLMLSKENNQEIVRLADFGLARVYQASNMSGLTVTGDIGGTIAFIAPEQITSYREARPPVDQYSAAATLYNLLTDQFIYDLPRELPKQIALILNEDPQPLRNRRADVPDKLAAIIHKALARDPAQRYPDVRALHDALFPFTR